MAVGEAAVGKAATLTFPLSFLPSPVKSIQCSQGDEGLTSHINQVSEDLDKRCVEELKVRAVNSRIGDGPAISHCLVLSRLLISSNVSFQVQGLYLFCISRTLPTYYVHHHYRKKSPPK